MLGRRIDEAVLKAFDEAFVPETELSAQLENLRPNHLRKKEEGVEKARLEKRKMEIDKEQHTLYGVMGAMMMEKGDDCAEIQLYKQQVFELTDELLKTNERLAALAEETDQS